ncbi:hypothetical protein DSECCO2_308290 [anaerobic digester metagenome]
MNKSLWRYIMEEKAKNIISVSGIIEPCILERCEKFVGLLNESLEKLDNTKINDLSNNELFITALLHILPAAVKNHQIKKLEYLRNVVIKSIMGDYDEYEIIMFLGIINNFTVWHFQLMELLDDPNKWATDNEIRKDFSTMGIMEVLNTAFPRTSKTFLRKIWDDLHQQGLVQSGDVLNTSMGGRDLIQNRTTELGIDFVSFISPI